MPSTDFTMATDTEDAGFLSRWSRRKTLVRQGTVAAEPVVPVVVQALPTAATPARAAVRPTDTAPIETESAPAVPVPPPPTLADVAALTRESDYSRFVGRSVQPEVRNAALGKLFTDPHFNVMDGLDTYIDDYGIPDPLPEGMLRKMLQAQVLGLFDKEDEQDPPPATPAPPAAAAPTLPEPAADENTDLQLQPDDVAGRTGAAPGTGEDARLAH